MERLCPERKVHPRANYSAQSDELLRFLLFFTLILFSHLDLMSSQAFLRSMFASEEESESESLLESESLDELSFFFLLSSSSSESRRPKSPSLPSSSVGSSASVP